MELSNQLRFPILEFLELFMPFFDNEFYLEILPKEEMGECFGVACPEEHKIVLREDVYNGAAKGVGMHRFTVAHEIGHYFLHKNGSVVLARIDTKEKIPAFKDPEWQADCFAGELLMPANLIKGKTYLEVTQVCEVSHSAALTQLSKI
jgi:predicted metalloprotease